MAGGVRRRGFGRSLLFAIGAFLISNLGSAAMGWLSKLDITPTQTAAVSTGVSLSVVFLTVILDTFKEPAQATGTVYSGRAVAQPYQPSYQPQPSYQQPPPVQYPPSYQQPYQAPVQPGARPKPPKAQRRVPWIVALVVILGLCGVGGFAATWGAQWLNGQAICLVDPKHYDGTERLAGPAAAASGDLAIEVTRVVVSRCGTVLTVHAKNDGDVPLELPVYSNASLTVPGRTSLGGDPRTSDWNQTVPAHGEMTGVLVFREVPGEVTKVTLTFNTIFSRAGARSISVQIPLSVVVTES